VNQIQYLADITIGTPDVPFYESMRFWGVVGGCLFIAVLGWRIWVSLPKWVIVVLVLIALMMAGKLNF